MNHTVLQIKGLCKTYIVNKHRNNMLKNIDLTISEGEMVAVMESSGSGKSTLLYYVSGMDRVTAGEVFFNGRETAKFGDVEDDKELAGLLIDFLRDEGYTVSRVDSRERAVQIFERYGARLVVVDINLSDVNGFAVCSKLRENVD